GTFEWRNATGADDDSPSTATPSPDELDSVEVPHRNEFEFKLLLCALPAQLRAALLRHCPSDKLNQVDELVLDLGHVPQLAWFDGASARVEQVTAANPVTQQDLDAICAPLEFGRRNRAGFDETLHRINRIVGRKGNTIGLTIRIGRTREPGRCVAGMLLDAIDCGDQSVLLVGKAGRGRTQALRDIAARLAARDHRVLVIDTHNDLGGPNDILHEALGGARRVQVEDRSRQPDLIREAVLNHALVVLIIDDVITSDDFAVLRAVAPRVRAVITSAPGSLKQVVHSVDWQPLLSGGAVFKTVVEMGERGVVHVVRDIERVRDGRVRRKNANQRRWLPWADKAVRTAEADADGQMQWSLPAALRTPLDADADAAAMFAQHAGKLGSVCSVDALALLFPHHFELCNDGGVLMLYMPVNPVAC
ncbi:hypothetical protein GGF31_006802, partial [Allomyces arbusculus]